MLVFLLQQSIKESSNLNVCHNDVGDFDNFVVQMERLAIVNAKNLHKIEE